MSIIISDRMQPLSPSLVREVLKVTSDPGVISFAAGNPSPDTFPAKELSALSEEIWKENPGAALQYGVTEGYGPLRELTKARLSGKYGLGSPDDEIIIVSGGQQGVDLAVKCLVNEGDAIICENPSFVGALNDFRSYRARLVGIPMDDGGMDIDALEKALKTEKNVKMIYTIPTFQNPMGVTMPMERRRRMYELAVKYNVAIVEDSPYFELRYSGEYVPAIKSLDVTGHVLYVGSYSKVIAPGMRVGFVLGQRDLIGRMTIAKQCQDVHTNMFFMMLVAKYLENYNIDAHIEECRALYKAKRDAMLSGIEKHFDPRVSFTRPEGGLFIWCRMPDGISGYDLCSASTEHKVAPVPGSAFDVNSDRSNPGIRLNFSVPSLEQINTGIEILGNVIKQFLK